MAAPTQSSSKLQRAESALAACAESFPQVTESRPWGHRAFKVSKKTFLFLHAGGGELSLSVKLPRSRAKALDHDFAKPTEYGLGRSGWVTAVFHGQHDIPLQLLKDWVAESFQAIAPKRLLAASALNSSPPKAPSKRAVVKKAAVKKTIAKQPAAKKSKAASKAKPAKKVRG